MAKKRVIFHIGAHKTGTTYLQSFFSLQADKLNSVGIDYPYTEPSHVTDSGASVGNVVKILSQHKLLKQKTGISNNSSLAKNWSSDATERLLTVAKSSKYNTILFSSEGMSVLPEQTFLDIYEKFNVHFNIEFILFVRDPFDYYYSAWRQIIKSSFSKTPFSTYISHRLNKLNPQKVGMFNAPRILHNHSLPHKLVNYDTYKKELPTRFLKAAKINFSPEKSAATPIQISPIHNRSLSPSEAELQLLINQQFEGTHFPAYFRTLLLNRIKHKPITKDYFNQELALKIFEYHKEDIVLINSSIYGSELLSNVQEYEDTELLIEQNDITVLINAIEFVASTKSRKKSFTDRLIHIFKTTVLRNVPFDFDPEAYLLMNGDVKSSNIGPYLHYSRNGHMEGRPYRFI